MSSSRLLFKRDTAGRYISEDGRFLIAKRRYGQNAAFYLWVLMDKGITAGEYSTLSDAKERAREALGA